ncbi:hypothetical protein GCM10028773_02020 [Spirosoma koreense]
MSGGLNGAASVPVDVPETEMAVRDKTLVEIGSVRPEIAEGFDCPKSNPDQSHKLQNP